MAPGRCPCPGRIGGGSSSGADKARRPSAALVREPRVLGGAVVRPRVRRVAGDDVGVRHVLRAGFVQRRARVQVHGVSKKRGLVTRRTRFCVTLRIQSLGGFHAARLGPPVSAQKRAAQRDVAAHATEPSRFGFVRFVKPFPLALAALARHLGRRERGRPRTAVSSARSRARERAARATAPRARIPIHKVRSATRGGCGGLPSQVAHLAHRAPVQAVVAAEALGQTRVVRIERVVRHQRARRGERVARGSGSGAPHKKPERKRRRTRLFRSRGGLVAIALGVRRGGAISSSSRRKGRAQAGRGRRRDVGADEEAHRRPSARRRGACARAWGRRGRAAMAQPQPRRADAAASSPKAPKCPRPAFSAAFSARRRVAARRAARRGGRQQRCARRREPGSGCRGTGTARSCRCPSRASAARRRPPGPARWPAPRAARARSRSARRRRACSSAPGPCAPAGQPSAPRSPGSPTPPRTGSRPRSARRRPRRRLPLGGGAEDALFSRPQSTT